MWGRSLVTSNLFSLCCTSHWNLNNFVHKRPNSIFNGRHYQTTPWLLTNLCWFKKKVSHLTFWNEKWKKKGHIECSDKNLIYKFNWTAACTVTEKYNGLCLIHKNYIHIFFQSIWVLFRHIVLEKLDIFFVILCHFFFHQHHLHHTVIIIFERLKSSSKNFFIFCGIWFLSFLSFLWKLLLLGHSNDQ